MISLFDKFCSWLYRRKQFITWHFYVPYYMFATVMMIWCLVVNVGGLLDGDLRVLWVLPSSTVGFFFPWFKDVHLRLRRLP